MLQSCLTRWDRIPGTSHTHASRISLALTSRGCCLPNPIWIRCFSIRSSQHHLQVVWGSVQLRIHVLQSRRTQVVTRLSDQMAYMPGILATITLNAVRHERQLFLTRRTLESV